MRKITFFLFLFSLSVLNAQSITPPFNDDFSEEDSVNGWTRDTGPILAPSGGGISVWEENGTYTNIPGQTGFRMVNIFDDNIDEYYISPTFDLSGGAYVLTFDIAWTEWDSQSPAAPGSDDFVALLISNDNGVSWVENQRWDATSGVSATGQEISVALNGYSNNVKIAFYAFSDVDGPEDTEFFIDNFSIVADATASVKEADKFVKSIFPNPVSDELFISTKKDITGLTLYDIRGAKVMSKKVNAMNTSINVAKLDIGVYILKLDINGNIATKRVVVK